MRKGKSSVSTDDLGYRRRERRAELLDSLAGPARHRHDRRVREGRAPQLLPDRLDDERGPLGIHEVDLRDRDRPPLHAERFQDEEVLAALGHHPLVGGDDEQHGVDPAGAGDHVLDEALVSGDVHDARGRGAGAEVERGEPEVDRDSAAALFGKPVRIDPGQGGDERGFAMIDVARGPHHAMVGADARGAPVAHPARRSLCGSTSAWYATKEWTRACTRRSTPSGSPSSSSSVQSGWW